eukprot:gene5905-9735_t
MNKLKKNKIQTLKDFYSKKSQASFSLQFDIDFTISKDELKTKFTSIFQELSDSLHCKNEENIQMNSIKQLLEFGDEKQYKETKLFDYFKHFNQKINISTFHFYLTDKSFLDLYLDFTTDVNFKFNRLNMNLESASLKNGKWNLKCRLNEGDVYSLVNFETLISRNTVIYNEGLKIQNNYFRENFDLDMKFIPTIYQNYSRKVSSISKYNFNFTTFSTSQEIIEIQLTDLIKFVFKNPNELYFYFDDYYFIFDINDKKNKQIYQMNKYSKTYKRDDYISLRIDLISEMFKLKNLSGEKLQFVKMKEMNLKFEEGFLELLSSCSLIRIPLHNREIPEVFIRSAYNSITDEERFKCLDIRKMKDLMTSIWFKFEN